MFWFAGMEHLSANVKSLANLDLPEDAELSFTSQTMPNEPLPRTLTRSKWRPPTFTGPLLRLRDVTALDPPFRDEQQLAGLPDSRALRGIAAGALTRDFREPSALMQSFVFER